MDPYRRTPRFVDFLAFLRLLRLSRILRRAGEALLAALVGLSGAAYFASAPKPVAAPPTAPLPDGTYVLLARNGPVCLEAPTDHDRRGATSAKGCWESAVQDWVVTRQQGGPYTLQSLATKSCLDMPWGTTGSHMHVIQFPCHGNTNQRWELSPRDKGTFVLRSAANGECLTAVLLAAPLSADVTLATCDGSASQQWLMTRVMAPTGS